MFEKKQIIFSENLGVCRIEDIVKLSANKTQYYQYYLMRSVLDKKRTAYIPVENHTFELRELISKEEAKKRKAESYNEETQVNKEEIEYVLGIDTDSSAR